MTELGDHRRVACLEHLGIDADVATRAGARPNNQPSDEAERESDEKHETSLHGVSLATGTDTIVETGR